MVRFLVRLMVLVVVPLALGACQTTGKDAWTEWKEISESQSAVSFAWPPQAKPVSIKREARKEKYKYIRQELWNWGSGRAWLSKLPGGRYYNVSPRDSGRLIKEINTWNYLKGIELTVDEPQIKQGVNSAGVYFYAVTDRNDGNMTCFIFFQALPNEGQSGFETTKGVAGGIMSAYECQPKARISVAGMEKLMVPFVEGVRMTK